MSLTRLEFSDGKSNKFYEVEVEGKSVVVRYGRIGTDGREKRTNCYSEAAAQSEAERSLAKKIKKGYEKVDPDAAAAAAAPPEDDSPLGVLERKLAAGENFDDWLVYADMLTSNGDPRGEYVNLGVEIAKAKAAKNQAELDRLRLREWDMLRANAKAWFGKFVDDDDWRECFGWEPHLGFWRQIRLWVDYDHRQVDIAKALGQALTLDSAKFLRELTLGLPDAEGSGDYDPCIKAILKRGPFPSLRRLTIGDFVRDESEISWVSVGNVGRLWSALTGLEYMRLRGSGIRLGTPKSASLRALELETGALPSAAGDALGRAELPALERLEVWFGSNDYGADCSAKHAKAILANQSFAKLKFLGLMNSEFGDDIAEELVKAKLPPGLEVLDLSMGTMTDKGAQRLVKAKDTLAGLKRINLDENGLSKKMCERVAKALPQATTNHQKQGEDAQYVSVGE